MIPDNVTVTVTQEHIDRGKGGVCDECAVALAFLDALPGAEVVEVRYWDHLGDEAREPTVQVTAHLGLETTCYYQLPYDAAGFVARFDDGLPVSPFTFTAEGLPS